MSQCGDKADRYTLERRTHKCALCPALVASRMTMVIGIPAAVPCWTMENLESVTASSGETEGHLEPPELSKLLFALSCLSCSSFLDNSLLKHNLTVHVVKFVVCREGWQTWHVYINIRLVLP